MTAPVLSVTMPVKVPASSCPRANEENKSKIVINRSGQERTLVNLALFAETSGANATSVQGVELHLIIRLSKNIAVCGARAQFSSDFEFVCGVVRHSDRDQLRSE
jgi:hypothetical protein